MQATSIKSAPVHKAVTTPKRPVPLGECPKCSTVVDGFVIDAPTRDDVTVTLKPCGCASHLADANYAGFMKIALGAWGLTYA
jgi:hypothetical protein